MLPPRDGIRRGLGLPLLASLLCEAACASAVSPASIPSSSTPAAGADQALEASPATLHRRLVCMGTWLDLHLAADDRATALRASEGAVRAIEAVEARLSTWREDSELSALNRAPVGVSAPLSMELRADLERARELWQQTDGLFDPGLGALVRAWGLREGGRRPSASEIDRALAVGGLAALELSGRTARRLDPGLVLEEGAFGKGIGLDEALRAALEAGALAALLDLGGQVVVGGDASLLSTWVGLAHPDDRSRSVLELRVPAGSLATSGNSERGIEVAGERLSHLIDPRTGWPAPDFGSLTVLAPDATTADALSTGLYVLGPDDALGWAARETEVELVLLEREGSRLLARLTPGWAHDDVRVLDPELELRHELQQEPTDG